MKVLHLTVSLSGGAGIACRRLHASLLALGVQSEIWTSIGEASTGVRLVQQRLWRWRAHLDRMPTRLYRRRKIFAWWSNNWLPSRLFRRVAVERPDLLHLHWVGDGWISSSEIHNVGIPVVWTLHDAWAFTGGCHYAAGCERFVEGCGRCPQLGSIKDRDLSSVNFSRKQRALSGRSVAFVAPSHWMARLASCSAALSGQRIEVIANGLDENIFAPADRAAARASLGISADDIALLVFVSGDVADRRKGIALVCETLARLSSARSQHLRLLIAGAGGLPVASPGVINLGRIEEEPKLVSAYAAADAHWLPALEDNLPNTAIEALACGCPVLANSIGGIPEIVDPLINGLLAANPKAEAHEHVLSELMEMPLEQRANMRTAARNSFMSKFRASARAADHLRIYQSLLKVSG